MFEEDLCLTRNDGIYEANFVRNLFDEMAQTYGIVNLLSSFGFAARWRKQCIRLVDIGSGSTVVDLMTGMGELCPDLARLVGPSGKIRAVDISPMMCRRAQQSALRCGCPVEVIEGDVLDWEVEAEWADVVVSTFGLKTLSTPQSAQLAEQIMRLLKPGGSFSLLEISVPAPGALRVPYMFYIKHVIPLIGSAFLGNPENYRMLGRYTEAFGSCANIRDEFAQVGLIAQQADLFFGCATAVFGYKPLNC